MCIAYGVGIGNIRGYRGSLVVRFWDGYPYLAFLNDTYYRTCEIYYDLMSLKEKCALIV